MAKITQQQIDQWLKAANKKANVSKSVLQKIIDAGEIMVIKAKKDAKILSGIDFSKPVKKIKLPKGVYIHFEQGAVRNWFTLTGYTTDSVGIALGNRQRKLYQPGGSIEALESTAKSVKDNWTPGRVFDKNSKRVMQLWLNKYKKKKEFLALPPEKQLTMLKEKIKKLEKYFGQMCRGGGKQFFVVNPSQMKLIPEGK